MRNCYDSLKSHVMPIRRSNYTKDWPEVSLRKREEAGWKCQECEVPEGAKVIRSIGNTKDWIRYNEQDCCWYDKHGNQQIPTREKYIVVCLAVCHLDQDSKNNEDKNLRVWCQCCHLNFDRPWNIDKMQRRRAFALALALGQLSLRI